MNNILLQTIRRKRVKLDTLYNVLHINEAAKVHLFQCVQTWKVRTHGLCRLALWSVKHQHRSSSLSWSFWSMAGHFLQLTGGAAVLVRQHHKNRTGSYLRLSSIIYRYGCVIGRMPLARLDQLRSPSSWAAVLLHPLMATYSTLMDLALEPVNHACTEHLLIRIYRIQ